MLHPETELYRVNIADLTYVVYHKPGVVMPYRLALPWTVFSFETRDEAVAALCKATGRDAA